MKIRFIEPIMNDPRIEIMPDSGKFDSMDAVITVSFFDYFEDKKIYRPLVRANVSFGGRMNPEYALHWARCFEASYNIANKIMPENVWKYSQDIHMCWNRVAEVADSLMEESV